MVTDESQEYPLVNGCRDLWGWDKTDKSPEVRVQGPNECSVYFHPNWSNGTAAARATNDLRYGRSYWEIKVSERLFGTSMMFGIGTKEARVHADSFINIIGEDCESWGLSHKGILWHDGKPKEYTKPFSENVQTTIGILFDGYEGTLSYYKDGVDLGVAFTGLQSWPNELYPMVSSTAAKTEMTITQIRRDFVNLQDRCRRVVLNCFRDLNGVDNLDIPKRLKLYIKSGRQKNNIQCNTETYSRSNCFRSFIDQRSCLPKFEYTQKLRSNLFIYN